MPFDEELIADLQKIDHVILNLPARKSSKAIPWAKCIHCHDKWWA